MTLPACLPMPFLGEAGIFCFCGVSPAEQALHYKDIIPAFLHKFPIKMIGFLQTARILSQIDFHRIFDVLSGKSN